MKNQTLIFEEVGMNLQELGGLSCRLRTRLRRADGQVIYLEISGLEKHKHCISSIKALPYTEIGFTNHVNLEVPGSEDVVLSVPESVFQYTTQGILNFVNTTFGRQFTALHCDYKLQVHAPDKPIYC